MRTPISALTRVVVGLIALAIGLTACDPGAALLLESGQERAVHRVGDVALTEVSASSTSNVHFRIDITVRSERPVEAHTNRVTITVGEAPVEYTLTAPSSLQADSTITVSSTKSRLLSYWFDVYEPYERENGSIVRGLKPGTRIVVSGTDFIQQDTTFFDLPPTTFVHRDVCDTNPICF